MMLVALVQGPESDQASANELPHAHGAQVLLAVDATHGSQAAHLDASSLRPVRHCAACLGHSRTTGRATPPGESFALPPVLVVGAASQIELATGPRLRRDPSRAPPTAP